jgi:tetratricopeptide (TPR) repeat protein
LAYANQDTTLEKALADMTETLRHEATIVESGVGSHLVRSAIYFRQNELVKALSDATEALRKAPKSADAFSLRGLIYEKLGEKEKAASDRETCKKIVPKASTGNDFEAEMANALHRCLVNLVPALEPSESLSKNSPSPAKEETGERAKQR